MLLIACANIANLLLARATARRHELSVRVALGASRWRLARQLLCESLVLAGSGAAAGLLLASWASRLLVRQLSTQTNTVFLDLSLDWRVLAFTIGVTVATALLFGTVPALRASGVAPMDALKEHGRGTSSDSRAGLASGLVVAQVALSLVLVVAAGLFMRTFSSLSSLHLGFDRDRVLLVTINAQRTEIPPADRLATFERIRQRVLAVPGVASAAVSLVTPVSGSTWDNRVDVSGSVDLPERERQSNFNAITPGWLTTFGTPLIAGRDIADGDRKGTPPIAIVNQTFARKFLNGASPIGHTVTTGGAGPGAEPPREIVGVVARRGLPRAARAGAADDVRPAGAARREPAAGAGVDVGQRAIRDRQSPALLARSVSAAITGVNRDLALTFRPLVDQVNASLTQERVVAMLAGFFGALALLLAGARTLRRDVVRGQPPPDGDRHPHGARRGAGRRRPPRAVARDAARRDRRGCRRGRQPVGVEVRRDAALRPRAARSRHARRRRCRPRGRRRDRRLAARTPGVAHRSGGSP